MRVDRGDRKQNEDENEVDSNEQALDWTFLVA
jgi:hypothetical protein